MRRTTLILTLTTIISACTSNQEVKTKKDTIFGLELGMKFSDANKLLEDTFRKDSGSYYFNEHQVTHFRGTNGREIEINFYKPEFTDSVLTDYSYTIQVLTKDEDYYDEFHKQILDELKKQYGNAKNVEFKNDNETTINWDLGDNASLELAIDKVDNLYTLNYKIKRMN